MDDGARAQFVTEIDQLGHSLACLQQSLSSLHESVAKQQAAVAENNNIVSKATSLLSDSALVAGQDSLAGEEQVLSLQGQLEGPMGGQTTILSGPPQSSALAELAGPPHSLAPPPGIRIMKVFSRVGSRSSSGVVQQSF